MFYKLFNHSVKSLNRNIRLDVNFVLKIISSLSFIYVCFAVLYLGLNFESLFRMYSPKLDPIESFNSILIYFFLVGTLLLFFFQKSRTGDIIPYLHLPISRGKIISYILVLTFFNFFNLGFILFIIPFSVTSILPTYGMQYFIFYLAGILLVLLSVSYFALLLRNLINVKSFLVLIPLGIVFLLIIELHVSLETISKAVFRGLLNGNIFLILLILFFLIGLLTANFSLLKNTIYSINSEEIETFRTAKRSKAIFLNSNIILYVLLELKLITRNKRLKGFLIIAIGFLFLFYYTLQNKQNGIYFSFIMYIILNGLFGYIFSQYLFSWESSYFDFILSTKFDIIKYLKAKHIIYVTLGFLVFLLFLPIILQMEFGIHLFLTALLFNSCIGYFVLFFMATFNRSRIDLNSNVFFNHQGYNGTQFIAIFIILIVPYIILLIFNTIMSVTLSLLFINLLSIFSILYQGKWFKIILRQLKNRKYINLEGYRK